jgi:hypothetical protein
MTRLVNDKRLLHGDGVVGVTDNVPAGAIAAVGKERVTAGQIFFGSNIVDLILDFIPLGGDREKANAMNRA